LVLVTVDGRQPRKSVGLTLEELAQLMIELGCREALNLDGGGSTTLVIRNRVVNSPSDQSGERPVSDALLIYPQAGRKPEP
jgi:exopolysaccharide biosynthesis protein